MKRFSKAKEPVRLRSKKLTNGNESLYLDIYVNGARKKEYLKMYLIPESTPFAKMQNKETLRTAEAIKAQRVIDIQNNEYGFTTATQSKVSLLDYMSKRREVFEGNGAISTAQSYTCVINHLKEYNRDTALHKVDKDFIRGFLDYLSRKGKPLTGGTKKMYLSKISACLNMAVKEGLIQSNPISNMQPHEKPTIEKRTRCYLTYNEVHAMSEAPCKVDEVKRAFLFACFCGLRLSDVRRLEWGNIHNSEGAYRAEIIQQKTGETLYLPLSESAVSFIPDIQGTHAKTDKVFCIPCNTYVERVLSEWAKKAGVNKHVTFHVSRHTFATLALTYGGDLYTVSKLLGHTNIATTQIYAKIVDEKKRKTVELIPGIANNEEGK